VILGLASPFGLHAERKTAINFRLPDIIFSSYFINIEHLFGYAHGVVLEGGYIGSYKMSFLAPERSAYWQTRQGYTLGVHYRYHFLEKMAGPFLGVFYKYGSISGSIISARGPGIRFDSTQGQPQIGFATDYQVIGLNFGARTVMDIGITATGRLGLGATFGNYRYGTEEFSENRDAFSRVFNLFLSIDVEISVGYAI